MWILDHDPDRRGRRDADAAGAGCIAAIGAGEPDWLGARDWLARELACDRGRRRIGRGRAARAAIGAAPIDCLVQPPAGRRKRLLVADMESTIIENEMLDELADFLGLRAHVAEITRRAMNGELDFAAALDRAGGAAEGPAARACSTRPARACASCPGRARWSRRCARRARTPRWFRAGSACSPTASRAELGFDRDGRQRARCRRRPARRHGRASRSSPATTKRETLLRAGARSMALPLAGDAGGRRRRQRPADAAGGRARHRLSRQAGGRRRARAGASTTPT